MPYFSHISSETHLNLTKIIESVLKKFNSHSDLNLIFSAIKTVYEENLLL